MWNWKSSSLTILVKFSKTDESKGFNKYGEVWSQDSLNFLSGSDHCVLCLGSLENLHHVFSLNNPGLP